MSEQRANKPRRRGKQIQDGHFSILPSSALLKRYKILFNLETLTDIKMIKLTEGSAAPEFTGINQDGKTISLSGFRGKKLILYFYPKDDTPGCTAEACNLNDNYDYWISKGYEVVGVSPDNESSHKKFASKYGLKFNIVSDESKEIAQAYGVWGEKKNYGKTYMGILRTTFVIDENGIIQKILSKVDTKEHTSQIIKEYLNRD